MNAYEYDMKLPSAESQALWTTVLDFSYDPNDASSACDQHEYYRHELGI